MKSIEQEIVGLACLNGQMFNFDKYLGQHVSKSTLVQATNEMIKGAIIAEIIPTELLSNSDVYSEMKRIEKQKREADLKTEKTKLEEELKSLEKKSASVDDGLADADTVASDDDVAGDGSNE